MAVLGQTSVHIIHNSLTAASSRCLGKRGRAGRAHIETPLKRRTARGEVCI